MTASATGQGSSELDVVSLNSVSRYYGRRRALAKVSLRCRRGTVTGLFGPNGSGKSTVLGLLSTLVQPTRGDVLFGERTAAVWGDALRSRIGVLGHDLFLYGDLTARENLEFFGRLCTLDRLAARVEAALERARLTDRANDRVSGFSRGLRQRLALERALLHEPRLVLLDEPFTGLDDMSSELLVARIRALRHSNAIVVMATHDFDTAEGIVDEAACLRDGVLLTMTTGEGRLRDRYRRALAETTPR